MYSSFNIWDSLSNAITKVFLLLISIFPTADATKVNLISDQLQNFKDVLSDTGYFFPVGTFFLMLASVVAIEGTLFTIKAVQYIASNISFGAVKQS